MKDQAQILTLKLKSTLNSSLISVNDLTNFVEIYPIDNDLPLTDDQ